MAANGSKEMSLSNSKAILDRIEELRSIKDDTSRDIKEREKAEKKFNDYLKKLDKEREDEAFERRLKFAQEEGDLKEQIAVKIEKKVNDLKKNALGEITNAAAAAAELITSKLDKSIDTYVSQIQAMNAHLMGTSSSFSDMTNTLQGALAATGLVKQESVFKNLTDYVKSGITYNVEQRAFLKTIADDISLVFDGWTSSMNQLIRIQRQDSTANRLALEYSLQTFLNENYQTSEYIKDSFASVSESLLTSQSTMTAQNAMAYEAVVQSWLGSMYSGGAGNSTIQSLAKAIDQLGSGDISNLGNGISNLVLMGAARAGLDYGSILNQGLNASTADQLLAGITSYMSEMGGMESNVVRSQLGKLFGVNITDLIAASNVGNTSGGVSTDINSTLFSDYSSITPLAVKFTNALENMMFTWGTNIAASPWQLATYKITEMVSSNLGKMLEGTTIGAGKFGSIDIGKAIQALPLVSAVASLFGSNGTISEIWGSLTGSAGNITDIFNSLGNAVEGTTVKISDMGVSGSAYIGTGSSTDILNSSINSLNSTLSESQVVTQEGPTLEENVATITSDVAIIVELLQEHLVDIDNQLGLMSWQTAAYTFGSDVYRYAQDNLGF